MEYDPADIIVIVPDNARKWSAEEAQEWAREALAGGPPDIPINYKTKQPIKWSNIKKCIGQKIRLVAKPKGLIFKFDNGSRKYIAGDTATSSKSTTRPITKMSTASMQEKSKTELKIRTFAKEEIKRYNKKITKRIRETQRKTTTFEFWESGKRIRGFLNLNKDINQDQIWFALEQWGRGNFGYMYQWFRYATYFYDWQSDLLPENPIFTLSETRIMNIIRATKKHSERNNLLESCVSGPFKDFSDEQFKWITGQSFGTFPQKEIKIFNDFKKFSQKILKGNTLSEDEIHLIKHILSNSKIGWDNIPIE